jgi:iron complex transport system substrate-binding protein
MHGGQDRADWRGRVGQVADAVNQADKIHELETALEDRQAELKEKHADVLADRRFAVINSYNEQEVDLNSDASMLGNILGPIGVQWSDQINATVGDEDGGEFTVSLEEINNAVGDADVLFYGTNLALEPTETFEILQDEPLYKNLKAVEDGNVYPIGKMTVAGYTDAMFSLDLLDEALTDLANK